MLKIKNIYFSYGEEQVLRDFSLELKAGNIHGILGANGAGKTTLFQIIYGLLTASKGKVIFPDKNFDASQIGYLETEPWFYPYMKGSEYIDLLSHGNLSFDVQLWNKIFKLPLNKLIDTYSTGMKKKLALLGIISQDKPVMLLDEPFNGLDLETVENLNLILKELKKENKIIVLTSHILEVLKINCDKISFLNKGTVRKTFSKPDFQDINRYIKSDITQHSESVIQSIFSQ
ncbi:ABC transporter ATP-binding protein [Fodinibius saliphilus]|uniref:ABC transporter ATP-binding protein n=1 Tax=Fodinibius saliphilus TaxID=1920650 RepID=UPI001108F4D9|nr:ATP-binding cassette domain-containing protein [Fodinibius saliphilus]